MSPRESLLEPLLSSSEDDPNSNNDVEESADGGQPEANNTPIPSDSACVMQSDEGEDDAFSLREEIWEMISLGFPLAVSFFCRMGMASTDSSFVGHIHDGNRSAEIYLAAAVLSDMCINVFITPPLAFNQVLNGLVGQAMGSGNPKMAGIWLQQSMFWLATSMMPCLIALFYVEPVLLALGFSEDVSHVAGTYAKFNIVWPVPNGLYQCMRFYFQAQGMPRPAMYNNIAFLFVNAMLNWILVFGGPFKWDGFGFVGAAISLSISRTSQPVVYFIYMFLYKKNHLATWPDDGWSFRHHTWDRTKEFMKQSLPNIGTLLFQTCASQATTVLVGRLGDGAIAASSALSTVSIPWSGTLSATCTTISSVRTGYHLGRGKAKAAKQSTWLVLHFITISNVLVAAIFIPFQGKCIVEASTKP
jgi:MATE family multidrug resistance protein